MKAISPSGHLVDVKHLKPGFTLATDAQIKKFENAAKEPVAPAAVKKPVAPAAVEKD